MLSDREKEVLALLAGGASNKEIAEKLGISPHTAKVHTRNIFEKLGVESRTQAAAYAIRHELAFKSDEAAGEEGDELSTSPSPIEAGVQEPRSLLQILSRYKASIMPAALLILVIIGGFILIRMRSLPAKAPAEIAPPHWQNYAAMMTPRGGLAAVVYETRLFAIGGEDSQGISSIVEVFDLATEKWSALSNKPTAVTDVSAVVIGGNIYIPGGRTADGRISAELEAYDPLSDRWQRLAPMPQASSSYALAAYEGRLYLFGGWDGSRYLAKTFSYNPAENKWQELTPMPTPRAFAGAGLVEGKIYIIGGRNEHGKLADNEEYSPDAESRWEIPWRRRSPLPEARAEIGVAGQSETIYVLGGDGEKSASTGYLYSPQRDAWQSFSAPLNQVVQRPALLSWQNRLLFLGGFEVNKPRGELLSYQTLFNVFLPSIIRSGGAVEEQ
jgi:DNA-binding CsgD family transcriptional regulator/N-acetylneuraminic acid mutarotase